MFLFTFRHVYEILVFVSIYIYSTSMHGMGFMIFTLYLPLLSRYRIVTKPHVYSLNRWVNSMDSVDSNLSIYVHYNEIVGCLHSVYTRTMLLTWAVPLCCYLVVSCARHCVVCSSVQFRISVFYKINNNIQILSLTTPKEKQTYTSRIFLVISKFALVFFYSAYLKWIVLDFQYI